MKKITKIVLTDGTVYENLIMCEDRSLIVRGYFAVQDYYGKGIVTHINEQLIKEMSIKSGD